MHCHIDISKMASLSVKRSIHKVGYTQDINNFRPISLLSIFDKIIERFMHRRLYDFLEHHSILFENQFGFRKNNSTDYALMEITEKI